MCIFLNRNIKEENLVHGSSTESPKISLNLKNNKNLKSNYIRMGNTSTTLQSKQIRTGQINIIKR
jgi:hypothetical protein